LLAAAVALSTLAACSAVPHSLPGMAHPQEPVSSVADGRATTGAPQPAVAPQPTGAPQLAAAPQGTIPMALPMPPPPPPPSPVSGGAQAAVATTPPVQVARQEAPAAGTERYKDYGVNPVVDPAKDHLSTFAVDVDTASYAIARRKLLEGGLPPFQAVRAEEFLNYFEYAYPAPQSGTFAVHSQAAPSPFAAGHHLVRVAVQARRVPDAQRKPVHLVYLVDVSGSMMGADRIELAKKSLRMLTGSLRKGDTVALSTYAGNVRQVLAPTGIDQKDRILAAIDDLTAGGSTAMASGIDLAYQIAEKTLAPGHVSHVVVLSDGDANVGASSHEEILKTIARHRSQGITLSTIGFGSGNYQDVMMEQLADKGDGNYRYIDSEREATRVFSRQVSGMLEAVARDVKVQVDFDPSVVKEYRLIGYENRDVADKDFRNDRVDGGEVGSGHAVTAVYDVVFKRTDASPLTVRLRAKPAAGDGAAAETAFAMKPSEISSTFAATSEDFRFAVAVTGFAEVLRKSPHAAGIRLAALEQIAVDSAAGRDDRAEFITLVRKARTLGDGVEIAR
jgi:Ca-activated chloride channel family protein